MYKCGARLHSSVATKKRGGCLKCLLFQAWRRRRDVGDEEVVLLCQIFVV